jgi:hypothetical protein
MSHGPRRVALMSPLEVQKSWTSATGTIHEPLAQLVPLIMASGPALCRIAVERAERWRLKQINRRACFTGYFHTSCCFVSRESSAIAAVQDPLGYSP